MGQQWDQGRNQNIPWNKWKWQQHGPKSVGHCASNPKREIHSITGLSQKQEKAQINNLNSHLKEPEKEKQTKPNVSKRKEIIKITAEINEIESQQMIKKINESKSCLVLWKY